MALEVKLEVFEGPLDLLLHLIEKNKVDIYDIPIVTITEQYLDYIKQMEREDMNIMSEFLVMAATLLDIKCRMLLPREVDEEGEEEDPRAELVAKLLEYKMYKYMSLELKDRQVDAYKNYFREKNLPKEVEDFKAPIDYESLIGDATLNRLHERWKEKGIIDFDYKYKKFPDNCSFKGVAEKFVEFHFVWVAYWKPYIYT